MTIKESLSKHSKKIGAVLAIISLSVGFTLPAFGSSHREAPLIAGDPKADATDFYEFVSPDNPNTVTFIANYSPFQEPAGGPNFYTWDPNAQYSIKVDSDGDAVEDTTYQFAFTTTVGNPNTFLYNTGMVESPSSTNLNVKQTYTLTRIKNGVTTVLASNVPVAPFNVGPASTPNYASLQAQAIKDLGNGSKVFVGQSDDPFFAELGGLFDLLTIRKLPGNAGGGVDGLKGYNVNSIVLQVPITDLTKSGKQPTDAKDPGSVIGAWTTASRQATTVLTSGAQTPSGNWVQVSRLGAPLVNEVVVPIGYKDLWNGSKPADDAQFANGVANPELGGLLNALYKVQVPPQGTFGNASQRDDLESIFLTGIPGLTKSTVAKPAEELRLNVAVPVSQNPNRMGVLGGDTQGYPNGRRLADDVVDISIQAVAGAAYPLFHPGFTPDPLATKLGDGVDANDVAFRTSFPYLALPHSGFDSNPHASDAMSAPASGGDNMMPNQNGSMPLYRLYNSRNGDHFYTSNSGERDTVMNAGFTLEGSTGSVWPSPGAGSVPLYRYYNTATGHHFYSTSGSTPSGFRSEGIIGYVQMANTSGTMPVYGLRNSHGDYLYTTSSGERDGALKAGYMSLGSVWGN